MRAPRICFVISEDWYFWSHRRNLAKSLMDKGWRVDVVTSCGDFRSKIEAAGILHHSVGLQRNGKNLTHEAQVVRRLATTFREIKPDIVHIVGMKPMILGSMAARIANVPGVVCSIAGLGWLFTSGGPLKGLLRFGVKQYVRQTLCGRRNVLFVVQNADHRQLLIKSKLAEAEQISLVPGCGVDPARFAFSAEPFGPPIVVTHARMLWDKGIGDVVEAAAQIKRQGHSCEFLLVGDPDPANPSSIPEEQLRRWSGEGLVRWQPKRDDIPELLSQAHIACLPSYHEGFPLSLVEAASCGRPIVTSDIPGCRDIVRHNETGLLVPRGNPTALANALTALIENPQTRRAMGRQGRQEVRRRLSCHIVNEKMHECYARLFRQTGRTNIHSMPEKQAA